MFFSCVSFFGEVEGRTTYFPSSFLPQKLGNVAIEVTGIYWNFPKFGGEISESDVTCYFRPSNVHDDTLLIVRVLVHFNACLMIRPKLNLLDFPKLGKV